MQSEYKVDWPGAGEADGNIHLLQCIKRHIIGAFFFRVCNQCTLRVGELQNSGQLYLPLAVMGDLKQVCMSEINKDAKKCAFCASELK